MLIKTVLYHHKVIYNVSLNVKEKIGQVRVGLAHKGLGKVRVRNRNKKSAA